VLAFAYVRSPGEVGRRVGPGKRTTGSAVSIAREPTRRT
jgi:hypothetical protein